MGRCCAILQTFYRLPHYPSLGEKVIMKIHLHFLRAARIAAWLFALAVVAPSQAATHPGAIPGAAEFARAEVTRLQKKDLKGSLIDYEAAAKLGHPDALYRLGTLYYQGETRDSGDIPRALGYYKRAADLGHARANYLYAMELYAGENFKEDTTAMLHYARRGAERGDAGAQNLLAGLYASGTLVKQDPIEAFRWDSLAALKVEEIRQFLHQKTYAKVNDRPDEALDMGDVLRNTPAAGAFRDNVGAKFSAAQLATARGLVAQWKPTIDTTCRACQAMGNPNYLLKK